MRASDWSTSLSHADSVMVPSGDLQPMTFIACGVDRSIGGGRSSWQRTSSWMNLPRLTIDVTAGSDAAQRKPGCVSIPARPSDAGQVAFTKVVLLRRRPGREGEPGKQRRQPPVHEDVLRREEIVDGPAGLVHNTSFTNFCVDV